MSRRDEPIRISSRPPWLEARQPFWRHQFVGGNAFMLELMASRPREIEPNASADTLVEAANRARDQLRRAARIEVATAREGQRLSLDVTVENRAGHKFPTGHPYRRAWLQVRIADSRGRPVFESGVPDRGGALPVPPGGFAPHWGRITRPDQVQIYEAVMGDADGRRTYGLLRARSYLKDNRIPPRGFPAGVDDDIAVKGEAAVDEDFNAQGAGSDRVRYLVDVGRAKGPLRVNVALLYQAVPPEAVAWLDESKGKESERFMQLHRRADKSPEVIQRIDLRLP